MPSRLLPGIGLNGFWNQGETWKTGGDANWLLLSVLVQAVATSSTAALPGSPTNGMIYLVLGSDVTNPNKIAVRDNGAWVYFTPLVGWRFFVTDVALVLRYNGSAWVADATSALPTMPINAQTGTAYTLVSGDAPAANGNQGTVTMNSGSANAITVPTNASVGFPVGTQVQVTQLGTGQTSVAAASGVTVNTPASLTARTRYSTLVLTKVGNDAWVLGGDMT